MTWRKYFGVAVLGAMSVAGLGGTRTGRLLVGSGGEFARAYREVQNSGVNANFVEKLALSVVVASAARPACHVEAPASCPQARCPRPNTSGLI